MWDPIAYALGFVDCDHISARCMLTIFMLFAIRTEASLLRMLDGSPQTGLHDPIIRYLEDRGVKINLGTGCRDIVYEVGADGKPSRVTGIKVGPTNELRTFDTVVCALDVPGIQKVLPQAFSRSNEQIVQDCIDQLHKLFPSSRKLDCTWSSVVKLGQSLYREKPGQDKYRPTQATPISNFFLAGSYTYQDYLDSMEGATRSGLMVADEIIARADGPSGLKAQAAQASSQAVA